MNKGHTNINGILVWVPIGLVSYADIAASCHSFGPVPNDAISTCAAIQPRLSFFVLIFGAVTQPDTSSGESKGLCIW
ncbi:hypothetical protein RUE5091_00907 [Ruegeria denitrificans]|uniref:Uncharacterized protein n=1 Tax=Ruegeria denitrificans TaxID=1715692 RepID=A0A0P1ICR1_9RHOB|nr:hypothetical protein RUE5091_00907 [Ruegeria denitrificans]